MPALARQIAMMEVILCMVGMVIISIGEGRVSLSAPFIRSENKDLTTRIKTKQCVKRWMDRDNSFRFIAD